MPEQKPNARIHSLVEEVREQALRVLREAGEEHEPEARSAARTDEHQSASGAARSGGPLDR